MFIVAHLIIQRLVQNREPDKLFYKTFHTDDQTSWPTTDQLAETLLWDQLYSHQFDSYLSLAVSYKATN